MSRVLATIAIEDAAVEPLGVKEAMVMAVEHLGGVQVLSVEVQEPEQLGMAGGQFAPPGPKAKAAPKSAPPPPAGQASARGTPSPKTAMVCCYSCAHYRSDRNRDADGRPYWGVCERTRKPVYDLKERCKGWAKLGG